MTWNLAPECISAVMLGILWLYSRRGSPTPSLRNKLFQVCFIMTLGSMLSNIVATILIYTLDWYTLGLTWVFNTIYFIATPLMGLMYFLYSLATFFENDPNLKKYILWTSMPGFIYLLLVICNFFTGHIFSISLLEGYQQGSWIAVTYYVFYLYCVACIIVVVFWGKRVSLSIRAILFSYPLIAVLVIVVQSNFPEIILSGSAATCAMLLIYLYLQNKQSSIDHLTRVPNRQEFFKMLDLTMHHETHFAILVISLQSFKNVNDTYGQHVGDAALRTLSDFLRKELVLHEGMLYRYSGDEFAILLHKKELIRMDEVMVTVFERMALPWEVLDTSCMLSAAIGIVEYPHTSSMREELLTGLEYAVSIAKKGSMSGKACYCTPDLLDKAKRREAIRDSLQYNLETRGFELHYQPIWNIEKRAFLKAEALLRMKDPVLGNISPNEFIPIAEESGMIIEITYLVLEKTCAFIRHLLDCEIPLDGIGVNFSALQFTQKDMIPRMIEIIQKWKVPFDKIKVEITESVLSENMEGVSQSLHELHDLGIHIGLDDFGTGYSNLIAVIGLPIDTVKLDKSLVWSSMESERFSIVVQNFSRAFLALGMTVLAEGVETKEQSQFVANCGCSLIQGFFYARPMPEETVEQFLQQCAISTTSYY